LEEIRRQEWFTDSPPAQVSKEGSLKGDFVSRTKEPVEELPFSTGSSHMKQRRAHMQEKGLLFEQMAINGMSLKNRLVRSGTWEAMAADDGKVTEPLIAVYQRLARGGVGLIIPGYSYVQENGRSVPFQIGIYSDDHIAGLRNLVQEVHGLGAKIALQLAHAGRQTVPDLIGGETPVAPSAIEPSPLFNVAPREIAVDEIGATIEAFGEAARRALEAGFDAVQLHGTHGYLLAQFLSPYTNRRTDEWGGTPEKRLRFITEVYQKVRDVVGGSFPVLIKLSVEEGLENGITLETAQHAATTLSALGIDAIEVSGGTLDTMFMMCRGDIPIDILTVGTEDPVKTQMEATFYSVKDAVAFEEAYWRNHAKAVKEVIGDVPLILVGGMKYPQTMEKLLEDGNADLISLCRALIREPDFPREMAAGRKDPSRCAYCNRCLGEMGISGKPLKCYNFG
jgi:2,4-dienoyl-CoA reductase-like NADH-dependent reductase (Old Yellow Enzyme family)